MWSKFSVLVTTVFIIISIFVDGGEASARYEQIRDDNMLMYNKPDDWTDDRYIQEILVAALVIKVENMDFSGPKTKGYGTFDNVEPAMTHLKVMKLLQDWSRPRGWGQKRLDRAMLTLAGRWVTVQWKAKQMGDAEYKELWTKISKAIDINEKAPEEKKPQAYYAKSLEDFQKEKQWTTERVDRALLMVAAKNVIKQFKSGKLTRDQYEDHWKTISDEIDAREAKKAAQGVVQNGPMQG